MTAGVAPLARHRLLDALADDGAAIGRWCRGHPHRLVPTCPAWTGADLLVHVTAYARWLHEVFADPRRITEPPPSIDRDSALEGWDRTLEQLLALLRDADPDAPMPNWSPGPQTAGFWVRRSAQDVAIHRVDAAWLIGESPGPIPADLALDGIAEYLDVFVTTAFATASAPERDATLALEVVDVERTIFRDLPHPGPVTTLRGTASDLLLALWHRRDPQELLVSGDRDLVASWPRI